MLWETEYLNDVYVLGFENYVLGFENFYSRFEIKLTNNYIIEFNKNI